MKKNEFTFEVSFNVNTLDDEKIDRSDIAMVKQSLERLIKKDWGWLTVNGIDSQKDAYVRSAQITAVKVKRIKQPKPNSSN